VSSCSCGSSKVSFQTIARSSPRRANGTSGRKRRAPGCVTSRIDPLE
jgi:hypothetical protein